MSQYLFSLHLNAHVMGLRPLYLSVLRPSLYSRIFIQQRHILPYKDGPCTGRVNVLNDLALTTLSLPIHKSLVTRGSVFLLLYLVCLQKVRKRNDLLNLQSR